MFKSDYSPRSLVTATARRAVLLGLALALRVSAAPAQEAIRFSTDLPAALAEAKETGKPVVLVFSAVWCPHCRAMMRFTIPAPEVQAFAADFLWVEIDIDRHVTLAREYEVQGTPSIYFLDATGQQRERFVGRITAPDYARHLGEFLAAVEASPQVPSGQPVPQIEYDNSELIWTPTGYRSRSICFSQVGYGPLNVKSQSPFQSLRMALAPRTPSTLARGQWQVRGAATWVNVWANDDEVFDPDNDFYGDYLLDYEMLTTNVAASYGITDTLEVELELNSRSRFGGSMDGFIQGFHDLTGVDQSGRELVPKDQFTFFFDPPNGPPVELEQSDRGTFSNSGQLTVQHNVTCGTQKIPAFSYAVSVRQTENDDLEGSGLDVGVSVAAARRFGKFYVYLTLGYTKYGDDVFRGILLEDNQFASLAALEWRYRPKRSFIFQWLASGASVAGDVGPFADSSNEVTFGWKSEVRKLGVLEVGLIENIVTFDNSPDFGAHIAFTQRF